MTLGLYARALKSKAARSSGAGEDLSIAEALEAEGA
jgi:hypothetical protein